jgi:hypothetical protein
VTQPPDEPTYTDLEDLDLREPCFNCGRTRNPDEKGWKMVSPWHDREGEFHWTVILCPERGRELAPEGWH